MTCQSPDILTKTCAKPVCRFFGDFLNGRGEKPTYHNICLGKPTPRSGNTPTHASRNREAPRLSPELEHVFLLFVIKGHFTDGFFQTHRDLAVVRDPRSSCLGVLVETHFLVIYDTVNIVPGPEQSRKERQGSTPHFLRALRTD